ncbi:MAG: glycosyltransferase family A protein [Verrucomicrobiia bacterium]|jgi:glycosyltransferase involved in cell wall biosynthesis
MRTPLVSVLIPVFNGEPFLAECLESILAQDLGDYEVLISDDGSTDGSAAVIQRYAARDSRIRWWRNPRNLGIGGNFNAGLKAARGEFLKYVLQDDKLLDPSALRRMVAPMEKDASVSLVGSASHLIDSRSRLLEVRNRFRRSGVRDGKRIIIYCLEHNGNLIGEPSLVLFRKSQSARGFDEQLVQLLDLEMWFYLLEQGRFAYLAEPLCAFRQHPAQLTEVNRRSGASAEEDLLLLERYYTRPWMKDGAARRQMCTQAYYLRKRPGERAAALRADIARTLSRRAYATWWVWHKLTQPFSNFRRWLEKRRILR